MNHKTIFDIVKTITISLIIFLLKEPLFSFVEKHFRPIAQTITSTWLNDVMIISLTIFSIYIIYLYTRYKDFDAKTVRFTFIAIVIFFIAKSNNNWYFTDFSFGTLKYFDVLLVIILSPIIIILIDKIKRHYCKQTNNSSNKEAGFVEDSPTSDDKLGYKKYAKEIVNKITLSKFTQSFAIGINSQWGTGKTTLINLIKKNLNENQREEFITIDFNPWDYEDSKALQYHFFDNLGKELSKNSFSLQYDLNKYATQISGYNLGFLSNNINNLLSKNNITTDQLKERIKNTLSKINIRIIIFIDDIDRLDKTEIIEILKIIRNTGDFNNLIYICAYDKQYINEAVKSINPSNSNSYIEKVFNLELKLPLFNFTNIREYLLEELKKHTNQDEHQALIEYLNETDSMSITLDIHDKKDVDNTINNYRTAKRFINLFILEYNSDIKNEVNLIDFFNIQLIKFQYPLVFDLIKVNIDRYFIVNESGKTILKTNKHFPAFYRAEEEEFYFIKDDLTKNKINYQLSDLEIDTICNRLSNLFKDNKDTIGEKSIQNPLKFNIYFKYRLEENQLSEVKFREIREKDSREEFQKFIALSFEEGFEDELESKLFKTTLFKNTEDAKLIMTALFDFDSQAQSELKEKRYHSIDFGYINDQLMQSKSFFDEDSKFESFFAEIFKAVKPPFYLASEYLRNYRYNDTEDFLNINSKIALSINEIYFKEHLKEINKFNFLTWRLFWNCSKNFRQEDIDISPDIIEELKKAIQSKDTKSFIEILITEPMGLKNRYVFNIESDLMKIWNSNIHKIKEFILEKNTLTTEELEEFIKFHDKKMKAKGNIEFDFKHFNIVRTWIGG